MLPNSSALWKIREPSHSELLRLPRPSHQVALGEVAVGVALPLAALEQVGVVRGRLERVPLLFLRHPLGLRVVAFPLVHQAVGQGLPRKSLGDFDGLAAVASSDLDGLPIYPLRRSADLTNVPDLTSYASLCGLRRGGALRQCAEPPHPTRNPPVENRLRRRRPQRIGSTCFSWFISLSAFNRQAGWVSAARSLCPNWRCTPCSR